MRYQCHRTAERKLKNNRRKLAYAEMSEGGARSPPGSALINSPLYLGFIPSWTWDISPFGSFFRPRSHDRFFKFLRPLGDLQEKSQAPLRPHVNILDLLLLFPPSAFSSPPSSSLERRFVYFFLVFSRSRLHKARTDRNITNMRMIAITGFRSRKEVRSTRWGTFMFVNIGGPGSR